MVEPVGYTGISFPFRFTPDYTGGVVTSTTSGTDSQHIEEAILQILGTIQGERWMLDQFGIGLFEAVGRPLDEASAAALETLIREQLTTYEDRSVLTEVRVTDVPEEGKRYVIIYYTEKKSGKPGQVVQELPSAAA